METPVTDGVPLMNDVRRVLVVQTAFLGDVLLTVPMVRALRHAGAEWISLVTNPACADAARDTAGADEVIALDKRGGERAIIGVWKRGTSLKQRAFTAAVIPHRSMRSALLAVAAGAPIRIGFSTSQGAALLTHRVHYNVALPETHRNLSLLVPLGVPSAVELPWFESPGPHVPSISKTIVLAPGSQWGTKRWPRESFADLARMISAAGFDVCCTGSESERELCVTLLAMCPGISVRTLIGAPWTSLLTVLKDAAAVVTNDTAAMHAANLAGTPVVALFGPTVPEFGFGPRGIYDQTIEKYDLVCRPCNSHGAHLCPLGTHSCMVTISASEVFAAVQRIMLSSHANS